MRHSQGGGADGNGGAGVAPGEGVRRSGLGGPASRGDVLGGTTVLWAPGPGAFLSWGRRGGLVPLRGRGGVGRGDPGRIGFKRRGRSGEGYVCWELRG